MRASKNGDGKVRGLRKAISKLSLRVMRIKRRAASNQTPGGEKMRGSKRNALLQIRKSSFVIHPHTSPDGAARSTFHLERRQEVL